MCNGTKLDAKIAQGSGSLSMPLKGWGLVLVFEARSPKR